jgi:hypothetical protein
VSSVFLDALLHNRAALLVRCGMAFDSRQHFAHLLPLFQELAEGSLAFPMESFQCFALVVIHAVVKINTTRVPRAMMTYGRRYTVRQA